jgi:hypothetical protein
LGDPFEPRRYGAVYALGFCRSDKRAVAPLIRVLEDRQEAPRVRALAAECLGNLGKRKAIKALIACSTDGSAEVRFWCVFALGQFWWRRDKRPIAVVRALEARLDDTATPDDQEHWWSIGLEALAMLSRKRQGNPREREFTEKLIEALKDPLGHTEQWPWADFYVDSSSPKFRELYHAAERKIGEAGFSTSDFGKKRPSLKPIDPESACRKWRTPFESLRKSLAPDVNTRSCQVSS